MSKVVLILYDVVHNSSFEWLISEIPREQIELVIYSLNVDSNSSLELFSKSKGICFRNFKINSKSNLKLIIYFILTFYYLVIDKPNIVHCHIFEANLIGLVAGKILGIKKRYYTRHHSNFHHAFFPKGVKYDLLCNKLATKVIAVSSVVRNILIKLENVPENKVITIEHGFNLKSFYNVNISDLQILKIKYDLLNSYPIIGVVSRYTKWKGIEYIIIAFEKLLLIHPNAVLVLANAIGEYKVINQRLQRIDKSRYREIKFEKNISGLMSLFDIFVHVPIDSEVEAFGQVYVEALAVGIPSIFTLSGIANDFVKNEYNALVVDYENPDDIFNSLIKIIDNKKLKNNMIVNGKESVKCFGFDLYISKLMELYVALN